MLSMFMLVFTSGSVWTHLQQADRSPTTVSSAKRVRLLARLQPWLVPSLSLTNDLGIGTSVDYVYLLPRAMTRTLS